MNLLKTSIAYNVKTTIHFTPDAACAIMGAVFAKSNPIGLWCKEITIHHFKEKTDDLWLVVPCGGSLKLDLADGNSFLLDFDNLAAGFANWYEDMGANMVPIRLDANKNLCFDPHVNIVSEVDTILQYCVYGYKKYGSSKSASVASTGKRDNSVTVHNPQTPFTYTGQSPDAPKGYKCDKCAKERSCMDKQPNCNEYVREAKDGGYYG